MRERTDFMVLSLGDEAAANDEEIFAGGFWNRAAGGVMLCRFRVYTVCPSVTTAHLQIGLVALRRFFQRGDRSSLIFLRGVLAVFAVFQLARLRFWISAVGVGHQRGWTLGGEFVGVG